ncbi:16S rRNA (uracil(1498)-N(3))-methyltransferase [Acidihalobacter ferrooxydans]|uniref:Ribosomal RNA small subunit methyltransferase E n=1 Tax=Acidihalobacter ferrooxydans TaxID=1765967 RepID=A0A1P8UKC5_9GAMM|nr:16S rRNA (uracil(1498)-N(3))-methyltransferase [Acidihalobacter ferrooxydans]APZ44287.1 16S rRNA (uracil(1498)-N(3))-methyltransferase [Acidihalobacter ferrooxydans]
MRIPRIYTGPDALHPGTEVELPDHAFRHTVHVLRLRPGAQLVLFNGDGHDYPAQLANVERRRASAQIQERTPNASESALTLHLIQAISKAEHMDLTLQKAVELGVQMIQPVLSTRGLRLPADRLARKLEHWRGVAVAACEQCGRSHIPHVREPLGLNAWLDTPPSPGGQRLLLEPTAPCGLDALAPAQGPTELLIGPEGGFAPDELAHARRTGAVGVRLGPRVLRTETAGIVALALLQARWGDLT